MRGVCYKKLSIFLPKKSKKHAQIGNPKHFFLTGSKTTSSFLPKKRAIIFYRKRTLLKMSLNEKKRRRPSSSMLNLAFGTVGVFTLALSSPYAEAKETQKHHRSSGDDVVHGVGDTQVRGSSSSTSSSSSSSLKRNNARDCLLYTSPSPRDRQKSRMPSSA